MSVLKNLGYISEASYFPCNDPQPMLIIKAAANAGLITLWSAATFSCLDIVKMRAGISPWHARGLRALIGGVNPPDVQDKINGIYKFLIPVEKLLFFWFVVDLTTGFFANWESQIFKLGACGDGENNCSWTGADPAYVSPHPGSKMLVTFGTRSISGPCPARPSNGFSVPHGWYWAASFSINVKPIHPLAQPPGAVTTWIEPGISNVHLGETVSPAPWIGNDTRTIMHAGGQNRQPGGTRQYYFWASCEGVGVASGGSAGVTVSPFPIHNESIIPVNCFGAPLPGVQQL